MLVSLASKSSFLYAHLEFLHNKELIQKKNYCCLSKNHTHVSQTRDTFSLSSDRFYTQKKRQLQIYIFLFALKNHQPNQMYLLSNLRSWSWKNYCHSRTGTAMMTLLHSCCWHSDEYVALLCRQSVAVVVELLVQLKTIFHP